MLSKVNLPTIATKLDIDVNMITICILVLVLYSVLFWFYINIALLCNDLK